MKAQLDRDVKLGVIEPVPWGEPTTWCSRMVTVAKENGSPRRTVDLQALNNASVRQTHHTPSPFHQAMSVPHNMKKSVLDAWNGYHSLFLTLCGENGITLNPSKFQFAEDEVLFAGFKITPTNVQPSHT